MSKAGSGRSSARWSLPSALAVAVLCAAGAVAGLAAHGFGAQITWNREISRIVYDRCASCHRPGGSAFSLMTYSDVQPRANAMKDAVLSRRMPPWGAVKGFGRFRNDQSLTQEQIELITKWVDGGIRRGNNPRLLPKEPSFRAEATVSIPPDAIKVQGQLTLRQEVALDGLQPESVPAGRSMRIVATLPGGRIEPLVWLHDYDVRYAHPFLFRKAIQLPAGSQIQGVPPDAVITLLPVRTNARGLRDQAPGTRAVSGLRPHP